MDCSENYFSFKKERKGKDKRKSISSLVRVCSLLKRSAKLDVMLRGCPCLHRVFASPARVSQRTGPPPGSDSSLCTQVGAEASTEKPNRLPKLRNKPLPPGSDGKGIPKSVKATLAKGFAPVICQALARSGSGGAEYLLPLAQTRSLRRGLPLPRPQKDALAGGKVASGDSA